ncbi:MAG: hypothetical protein LH649_10715 [Pseudanabaena sp. CAN_BIN31]|nr:hypothetical protein [Pseudanabaena sp. CAN_BIN31]
MTNAINEAMILGSCDRPMGQIKNLFNKPQNYESRHLVTTFIILWFVLVCKALQKIHLA